MKIIFYWSQLVVLNSNKTSNEGSAEKQCMKLIESQIMKKDSLVLEVSEIPGISE